MTLSTDAPSVATPAGAPAPRRSSWHRIYFLLAGFDVLTVCLALFITHQLMAVYTHSVGLNAEWVTRINAYSRLGPLAAEVNAPGNDIFESHDVALESRRLDRAKREFDARLAALRGELSAHVDEPVRSSLDQRLQVVGAAMSEMTAEADVIFDHFRRNDVSAAGSRMASMDRTYHRLNARIDELRAAVREIQRRLFTQQLAAAGRLRNAELLLAAMILLMVAAAILYGRRVARQTERYFVEREIHTAALEEAQLALAAARDELEHRVRQRTAELQGSELRTRSIVANAHDAYVGMDANGLATDWNIRAEAMFGWTAAEAIGQPVHALIIPPEFHERHQRGLQRYLATGEAAVLNQLLELPARHRDGHEFPVEMTISSIHSGDSVTFSAFLRDITERKRAQEELDRFFSLSLDMLCIASYDGYFLRLNPAWETVLGYAQGELMAQPFMDFVHPDDRAATAAVAQQLAEGHETRAFVNRYRCKDGSWKWLLWQAAPTADRSRIYAAAHDITEEREAQEQLQQHAASLAEAQGIARLGNWYWDVGSDTVHWSEQMFRVFGIDPAAFTPTYEGFLGLVHPEDRERVAAVVERSLADKEPVNFEHRALRADGSVRYIQARTRLVLDANGGVVRLVGTAQDISDRARVQEALRISEERFRIVAQATNDVIWDWDLASGIVSYNRAFSASFAPAGDQYRPTTALPMENVHPDDHARVKASIEACLAGDADTWTGEYRLRLPDGAYADVFDRARVRRDAQGKATRMVGSMMDVTLQKRQQDELRLAKEAAEGASRAKGDFLANMSHEIRTPMNGVLGTIGLLLDSPLSPWQRELATLARSSSESLLYLIDDILDFSKIEAGKLVLEPIPFDLLHAAEDVADIVVGAAAKKNLDLVLRYARDVPRYVIGDPGRIRQVLTNLLGNAIKFTDAGQVLLDIEAMEQDEHSVVLRMRVEDTGIGIPPEHLGQIFDKFTQADASTTRRHGGTGLGLAISSQLARIMGGSIGADSRPGEGSTFWFTLRLPLQQDAPAPLPPDADLVGLRVLIVDDNEVNRRVLHEQVVGWKMRSGSCASGEEALEALRAAHAADDPYRIAILDYQMPGMDGEALGRAIKADPALRDIVLVMLTSLGERGDASRLASLGFAAYLVKPARQSELLAALASVWSTRMQGAASPMVTRHTVREARPRREGPQPAGFSGARVLLAEDHPTNQLVASTLLRNLGCEVDLAANGREAVEMLSRARYDVVFMDCEMPVMDGFAATAAIRGRDDAKGRVPIVAVTAQAMQGDRERCLRAGMDDYISKPVQATDFAAALERWAPARRLPGKATESAAVGAATTGVETGAADSGVLDVEVLEALRALARKTDQSLLRQVFASFLRDGAERISTLEKAVGTDERESIRHTAHALKGASMHVGARRLVELARQLEAMAEAGAAADTGPLVARLREEFVRVGAALGAFEADAAASDTEIT